MNKFQQTAVDKIMKDLLLNDSVKHSDGCLSDDVADPIFEVCAAIKCVLPNTTDTEAMQIILSWLLPSCEDHTLMLLTLMAVKHRSDQIHAGYEFFCKMEQEEHLYASECANNIKYRIENLKKSPEVSRDQMAAVAKKSQADINSRKELAERSDEIKRAKQSITPQDLANAVKNSYLQDLG